jgi:hypothetical protein
VQDYLGERENAISPTFSADMETLLRPHHVIEMQLEKLSRTQPCQQHQVDEGEISISRETTQEGTRLVRPEWLD